MMLPEPAQYIFTVMICMIIFMLLMFVIVLVLGGLISIIRQFKNEYLTKEKHVVEWFEDD